MPNPQNKSALAKLATAACYISPCVMVAADIITIALNHNADPLRQTISGYALGPYGWLEKIGMVLVAISFFFIAANLLKVKNQDDSAWLRFVGALLVIVGIGFITLSIFNSNVIGTLTNFHGLVHQFTAVSVSVVFYISCIILMFLMLKRHHFRYLSYYSGLTFLVGLAVLILLVSGHHLNDDIGLEERLIAGFNLVWIVLAGPQIIKLTNQL
jgi:cation transport ATPase